MIHLQIAHAFGNICLLLFALNITPATLLFQYTFEEHCKPSILNTVEFINFF